MRKITFLLVVCLGLSGCISFRPNEQLSTVQKSEATATVSALGTRVAGGVGVMPGFTYTPTFEPSDALPNFDHVILVVLENKYLTEVIGNPQMPVFNALAAQNVLLDNYFAVAHPSLPNYFVLVSGSTQNIAQDCTDCFFDAPNLADEIEASGRTWKAYFEDMPSPCFTGSQKPYIQYFNPFIYFDSIRDDAARCSQSIVPLSQLTDDLETGQLPNFVFIMPNVCNSGHDCSPATTDAWLGALMTQLRDSSALDENSLVIITFDEGAEKAIDPSSNGEIATVLVSPLARPAFVDSTRYSHYSLLKTIETAWQLPLLGETAFPAIPIITAPWFLRMGHASP